MNTILRPAFLMILFMFMIGPPVFADTPKILRISEIKPGTQAVGFSVFRGVEPKKFDVELREVADAEGFDLIIARVSNGPMETPLEKMGAIAGMSGSPIFVGGCLEVKECVSKAVLSDNDVFLVGSLSYGIGRFTEGGPNAGLTSAEYMLGARLGGYSAVSPFSIRPPNRIMVNGLEFKRLPLFQDNDNLSLQQSGSSGVQCGESVKSEIQPGSMISVFLAKGTFNIAASGTVTWVDGNKVYAFGHPFFGTGTVSYPFVQVSVADTVQSPLMAYKIAGCHLAGKGAIVVDGMFEIAGVIGRSALTLPYDVELHIGHNLIAFNEEVAESPYASAIIGQIPIMWAEQFLGDTSYVSVAYQTRIAVTDQPEILLKSLIPAQAVERPLLKVFAKTNSVLEKLRTSGFSYRLESIKTHVDFVRGASVWMAKESFTSQNKAKPGETVHVNVVLEEWSSGAVRQVSIPVKVPEDFKERMTANNLSNISVVVQSADKFVDLAVPRGAGSLEDVIRLINESANRKTNILYVQQVMPLAKDKRETNEASAKLSVKPDWSWVELGQGDLRRLPQPREEEIVLMTTPELDHFIIFDKTFTISVQLGEDDLKPAEKNTADKPKKRNWFFLFLF